MLRYPRPVEARDAADDDARGELARRSAQGRKHSTLDLRGGHGAMSIAVTCNKCHSTFQVKDKYAGRPGACPVCHEAVYVPALVSTAGDEAAWCETELDIELETLARSSPATPTPYVSKLDFPCEACGQPMRAEAHQVGRKIRCGACNHKFRVPATSLPIAKRSPQPSAPTELKVVQPPAEEAPRPAAPRSALAMPAATPPVPTAKPAVPTAKPAVPTAKTAVPKPVLPKPAVQTPRPQISPPKPTPAPRPRSVPWSKRKKSPPQYTVESPSGIWEELTQKDLVGGSDAKITADPLAPGPAPTPVVPSHVYTSPPLEYRDESRGISTKRAISMGGTALFVLMILIRAGIRYERSQRRSDDRDKAAAIERADQQVLDVRHLFNFKAGYYVPGADPNDPNQGHFYIDLICTGPIPHHGCHLFLKSPGTRGYIEVKNLTEFTGAVRFEFQVVSTNTSDTGPFTAWMEETSLSASGARQRISNTITFRTVQAPPQY